ncbi:ComF family protein [Demequina flava]|uniref:ComF family protein n=1 Tax=Demequina flava TaxID=1095025 RepID=UPI000781E879|nr:ComF family protein [Demequina flava]
MDRSPWWLPHPLARAGRDLARCLVPVECAGCGAFDERICDECAAPWWEAPLRCEEDAPRLMVDNGALLPVWAIVPLTGEQHEAVAAWKDGGRRDLDAFFADAMGRQARTLGLDRVAVVPVPSRPGSVRRRGADLTGRLATAAARAGGMPMVRALTVGRGESRGASARQRWRSTQGAVQVRRSPAHDVILVDDVITTGATLAACVLALRERHVRVVGALVLACA